MSQEVKVAFIYDWFDTSVGGAERVLQTIHEIYPHAPWYTSHIDWQSVPWAKGWDIRPSFLQHIPRWFRRNRLLSLLLLPFVFESFDLGSYDVVVSISSAFAKGVITKTQTRHICYLLTPPRWLHNFQKPIFNFQLIKQLELRVRGYLQRWDRISAQRVDEFISISREVAGRCKKLYGRESEVLYPPFDSEYWKTKVQGTEYKVQNTIGGYTLNATRFFLIVSRLEPYKRVELGMEAYAKYIVQSTEYKDTKLVIVGTGSQSKALHVASCVLRIDQDIVWLEQVSDEELAWLYANCRAFLMPQEEDFGYVACEAAACGAPIVAYTRGGQVEILRDYPNKILFDVQNPDSIVAALEKITSFGYNARTYENCNLRGGSRESFVATLTQKITQTV